MDKAIGIHWLDSGTDEVGNGREPGCKEPTGDASAISNPKRVKVRDYGQAPYSGKLRDISVDSAGSVNSFV